MSDLVERLREWTPQESICQCSEIVAEAAAELTALRAEVERLRAALERIDSITEALTRHRTHWHGCEEQHPLCTIRSIARAALAQSEGEANDVR